VSIIIFKFNHQDHPNLLMTSLPVNSNSRRRFLKLAASSSLLLPASLSFAGMARQDATPIADHAVRDAMAKAREFDQDFSSDIYLDRRQWPELRSSLARLARVRHVIGYANFSLLCFDDALRYARRYSVIGAFTRAELDFLDSIFNTDARIYGFLGEKTAHSLTESITRRDVVKLQGSGQYLYRGDAHHRFLRLQRAIGPRLQLTSGIRGIVKQLHLFLAKANVTHGNLSRAARQLAPPGHSFHGIGDFDVGQLGLGAANFTARFASSEVFKRLQALGYSNIRYPQSNPYGVRYEPWHIKVVSHA
jgi:D-alanyl-D-alanine carboxypeptidase